MSNYFKAFGIAMTVLSAVAEATDTRSEGGETITTSEIVRIVMRAGIAAASSFGADFYVNDAKEIADIVQEELEMAHLVP